MFGRAALLLFTLILLVCFCPGESDNRIIPLFVESVVGSTTLHRKQNWKFDPNEAAIRNKDFEAEHGHKSTILIEKLGLGIDGYRQQRKEQQAIRDSIPIGDQPLQNLLHPS